MEMTPCEFTNHTTFYTGLGNEIQFLVLTCFTQNILITFTNYGRLLHTAGGFVYSFMMVYHQISVLQVGWETDDATQSIVTTIIGFGEAGVTMSISLLAVVIKMHCPDVICLFNQILEYDAQMMGTNVLKKYIYIYPYIYHHKSSFSVKLTTNGNIRDKRHKKEFRTQDIFIVIINICSLLVPAFLMLMFAHPIEPTRCMIKDWLEVEISISFAWAPVLAVLYILIFSAANSTAVLCLLVAVYYSVSVIALEDIKPIGLVTGHTILRRRYCMKTRCLGDLEDVQIITEYRKLQLFNRILNDILGNIMISFHAVACLGAVVSMGFFLIAYNSVLEEIGILGYVVVISTLCTAVFIQAAEAQLLGTLCEVSREFGETSQRFSWRQSVYGKFVKTCKTFFIEEAYPFYHINKDTIVMFCDQCLGCLINLLVA